MCIYVIKILREYRHALQLETDFPLERLLGTVIDMTFG